ncbi:UNVERIFIED_CONTAM: mrpD [Trichonephila clavipes]
MGAFTLLVLRTTLDLARVFSTAATVALLGVSVMLLHGATVNGPEVYFLGDWPAPFGIVLVLDRLSALMVVLTAFLALVVQLYAIGTGWDRKGRHFHALWQFQLMGVCGAFLTGDAFNLFVFFEVLLIASYGLMIHGGGRDRLKAGVQYVAYNLLGSTLFLFALATIYSVTGTLNMADLAAKLPGLPEGDFALIRAAGVMLLMVFAIKGALVPLHFWLPATYAEAPGPVAALFAVMTKVGAYAVIRCYTLFFPEDLPATGLLLADLLLPAALITLFVSAFGVMGARNLGRVAAFAAITSMGTLFTAVAQFTPEATAAALYYAVHSTLAGGALFLIADLVISRRGTGTLTEALPPLPQNGLLAAFFMASAIATAGMPPLSGQAADPRRHARAGHGDRLGRDPDEFLPCDPRLQPGRFHLVLEITGHARRPAHASCTTAGLCRRGRAAGGTRRLDHRRRPRDRLAGTDRPHAARTRRLYRRQQTGSGVRCCANSCRTPASRPC